MSFREKGTKKVARDRQGNAFPRALPAFSVNDEDEWFKLISLVGTWRYAPREGEVGVTARLTGWPHQADFGDLQGATHVLVNAYARLMQLPAQEPNINVPGWAIETASHFAPEGTP